MIAQLEVKTLSLSPPIVIRWSSRERPPFSAGDVEHRDHLAIHDRNADRVVLSLRVNTT
jgi:hypothetical protein